MHSPAPVGHRGWTEFCSRGGGKGDPNRGGGGLRGGCAPPPPPGDPELLEATKKFFGLN